MLYWTVHSQLGFGMQFFLGLIGLCFIVADFTTEDIPLWGSVACVLVIPWGITVTLLLKTHMMMRLLKMFNVWYLLSPSFSIHSTKPRHEKSINKLETQK